jgi:tetratricopeptide (TPR) repeat protein
MVYTSLTSQKGFSLIRIVILLVILAVAALVVLNFLPRIGGGTFDVINQIVYKAKSVVNGLISKITGIGAKLAPIKEKLARLIEDLKDRWYRYRGEEGFTSRALEWDADMNLLIDLAEENGYNMKEVLKLRNQYQEGEASARRVEVEFWKQIQNQTADIIMKNIERFRTRPLGCSDFTDELKKIWDIGQKFNEETLEGYFEAKTLSQQLDNPRSLEFTQDIFEWLGFQHDETWYLQQLADAITKTNSTPDYPRIIGEIDSRISRSQHLADRVLGNITAGEIYLNYDLINPAQDRFEQAIRDLADISARYGNTIPPERAVGLHMALGLLNERVCKNNDLAVKEFKDVIACAKRNGFKCEDYNDAHYHLGIINLRLREGQQVEANFEPAPSSTDATTDELLTATPTPVPTPTPIPTPTPNPIKVTIEIPRALKKAVEEKRSRDISPMGVTKGTISVPRPIRLRPREELGESQKMKQFSVEDLYDLSSIPDDAIREFELFLKCTNTGSRVQVARFIHDRYMGK